MSYSTDSKFESLNRPLSKYIINNSRIILEWFNV